MKNDLRWLARLLPSENQTFGQRFSGVLILWAGPVMIWEVTRSGIFHDLSTSWPILMLIIGGGLVGSIIFAGLEHLFYNELGKRAKIKRTPR
jgi:hypothetical protein